MDLQLLRQIDLFKALSPVHLAHLASIMTEATFKKNTIIFEEGDEANDFFVIQKGRGRISKVVPGMGEEALAILPAGAYFGEMDLIDGDAPRVARATAHEDCVFQTFRYDEFHTLLSTDNELALAILWNMVHTLSARLTATDEKVAATFALAQFK